MRRTIGSLVVGQNCLLSSPQDIVFDVARSMAGKNVGAVPVMDRDKLIGIFTERDILKRVVAAGLDPRATRVEQVMTSAPETSPADEGVIECMERMKKLNCRHMPILEGGRLLGVVSLRDLLMLLLKMKQDEIEYLSELFEYLPVEPGPGG
ncbi:MAG: CBS domain-containing protein [Planctomycetes bacterium]|nr:CBS domain-containing protein [Planctomycetota bacterium]